MSNRDMRDETMPEASTINREVIQAATADAQWFVAQTHPRAEAKAAAQLMRQGFHVYLPRFSKRRRHARRVDIVGAPLFPRYLFVSVDLATQRWLSIRSTVGVARLICNGDAPAVVQNCIVDDLKQHEDEHGFIKLQKRPFRIGEELRVVEGAFTGTLGLYEGMSDAERITILLDLLGRKVRVSLDIESVAVA
jgi:transcriptional antiterminator RfaH